VVMAFRVVPAERALQTSHVAESTSTSDVPFFPDPSTLVPPTQTSDSSHQEVLSKSILVWVFFVVALVLVGAIIIVRSWQLRRSNRSCNEFFNISGHPSSDFGRRHYLPRTTGLPSMTQSPFPAPLSDPMIYPSLPPPTAYYGNQRRIRAMDTDEGGRRAGIPEERGDLDQKDVLPAYDNVGGPPKYAELEMDTARRRQRLDLSGVARREPPQIVVVARDGGGGVPGHDERYSDTPITMPLGSHADNRGSNGHADAYDSPPSSHFIPPTTFPRHPNLAPIIPNIPHADYSA